MSKPKLTVADMLTHKFLRVKKTADTRRNLVYVTSAPDPLDMYVHPGEVGVLDAYRVQGNGWQQWVIALTFPRNRRLELAGTCIRGAWSDSCPRADEFDVTYRYLDRFLVHKG